MAFRKEIETQGPDGGNLTPKRQGHVGREAGQNTFRPYTALHREGMFGGSHRCVVVSSESEAP
jgi:hypothetical protein